MPPAACLLVIALLQARINSPLPGKLPVPPRPSSRPRPQDVCRVGGSGVGPHRGFPSVFAFRAWVPSAADWKGKLGSFSAGDKARPAAPAPAGPGAQGGRWQGEPGTARRCW